MARLVELPAPGRGAYDRSLTRAQRDAQHRERLLRATAEIMLEGNLTVARIVERAGVGRSTFYEFFDTPEHVLAHLEQRVLSVVEQALGAAFASSHTPLERLRAIVRAWLLSLDARPLDARVVLARRGERELLSAAGKALHAALERTAAAARSERVAVLAASDELTLLAAAASAEVVARHHLQARTLRDPVRALTELVSKLLR
jgi:AcrR family transcriptional regulator